MRSSTVSLLALLILASCSSGGDAGVGPALMRDGGTSGSGGSSSGTGGQIGSGGSNATGGATASSGGSTGASGSGGVGPGSGGTVAAGGATPGSGGVSNGTCKQLTEACNSNAPDCCGNLTCVSSTSTDYSGCREPCATATDCASGCCIPFGNFPNKGFCGAASLCQCSKLNETCGGTHQCCAGFTCTTYDQTNVLGCRPLCKQNSDCTTDCCIAIPTTTVSACFDPSWCGK
jgi:hypothetical protein